MHALTFQHLCDRSTDFN